MRGETAGRRVEQRDPVRAAARPALATPPARLDPPAERLQLGDEARGSIPAPPSGNGQPSTCAAAPSTSPAAALTGSVNGRIEWAAIPANSARAASPRKRRATRVAGWSPSEPEPGHPQRPRRRRRHVERAEQVRQQRRRGVDRSSRTGRGTRRRRRPTRAPSRRRRHGAGPRSRRRAGGRAPPAARIQRRPCAARAGWRSAKNGEIRPKTWIELQTSWTNPGSVSSAERDPPPGSSAASRTVTRRPA